MCDMQKLPTRDDSSCEDDPDMNFAAFSAVGSAGTHFVTGGQLPVTKIQQNVSNNGTMQQVCVAMGEGGVQYVRALDGGATLQATPQLISVPIALPGAKPGDPQPTVQIQVLNPNHLIQTQQQPKYQMQIPIQGLQGFQQGGAVLTLAYSPEGNETGGIQLVGQGGLGEGLQVLAALPQEMQLVHQTTEKEQMQSNIHQVFITPNQQVIINSPDGKPMNNNTSCDNNNTDVTDIIIKEECDDANNDDESSQGTESGDVHWQIGSNQQDLVKYLSQLPPQQTQQLPVSLQQFLRLNSSEVKREEPTIEMMDDDNNLSDDKKEEPVAEAVLSEDGTLRISKKKKKSKKKPPKPARPKPGQVVIATAMDGSPIFCCPECHMAYPEKEQLEVHLLGHNIERRFICGICGAGLKRKEHLERHKLGHNPERPYVCGVCRKGFKRREHLNLHTVIHSGVKTEMCQECGKGFYRKDHLRKHTRSHESKRLRDEAAGDSNIQQQLQQQQHQQHTITVQPAQPAQPTQNNTILPEITIHIPTSSNSQMPVQINIPPHVVTSLAAAQAQAANVNTLDQLLANHS